MATEIVSIIGSGTEQFRQDNIGKGHKPALAVHVVNWEDQTAVGAIRAGVYPVVNAATALPSGISALAGRRAIAVYNNGGGTLYVGGSNVSVASGYPVPTGVEKVFSIAANMSIYAISASGVTVDVRTLEIA